MHIFVDSFMLYGYDATQNCSVNNKTDDHNIKEYSQKLIFSFSGRPTNSIGVTQHY